MLRILMADDHALMREGLKHLFSVVGGIDVVAEASTGPQVFELLRRTDVDLILLDMTMPGISGATLIHHIRSQKTAPNILVLSMHDEVQFARRALDAGASGYITKDTDPQTLIDAIHRVAEGGRFISRGLAEEMLFDHGTRARPSHELLSTREYEIFQLLVHGRGVNEIADELSISNKTVSTHKTRLMEKMKCENVSQLIRYAIAHGMLE
ncbi:two-component response regulator [Janthinobacterium sp. Marseille]|uniref:Response regulator n=1 Tax=Herminiimonas aquatilis TaxID=345342 RepID=A0ABW2J6K7_9BURK|nr:response regulator transcription factor [Janthinobacterium sp. Marseille]ABR91524.1 two-component response regulator [Janthinobacterium sp. Marseille]